MSHLFSQFQLRNVKFKNRVFVSPMCQYSCVDGLATDWHLVHLGSRAVGGASLVMVEATAVAPEGRISPVDLGLWSDAHAQKLAPISKFIHDQGSIPAIQLAHAGRKASTPPPWEKGGALDPAHGGWQTIAPSALAFSETYPMPRQMTASDIEQVKEQFRQAIKRSLAAGFSVIEIHAAHGYLLHQFLSPLSNLRQDQYGGDFAGRTRFPLEVIEEARQLIPNHLPLFVRISATDWAPGGWDLTQSIAFCKILKKIGVDLVDCSSGGLAANAKITLGPGYQVPFADEIRKAAEIPTGAVGMITEPMQAEGIVAEKKADVVFLARELLRNPYWPLQAARVLGVDVPWPKQYERAKPHPL